jgi:hypothetical protein
MLILPAQGPKYADIKAVHGCAAGLTQVYPQNAALSFMADQLHMRGDVPDGTSTRINIHDAEQAKKLINYGEHSNSGDY